MTTPSDALPAPAEGRERRLHPWSWLFVLLQQLKQFALPLIVLLFTGRGDRNEFWSLIGVGVLALVSVAQYFTYRYRVGAEGLTIRSGLFQRTVRHIPFDRVHNVALQQSLLHRIFGVAEVRLESAGGTRPEASMRVLSLRDAQALEQRVRDHARPASAAAADEQAPPVLALRPGELVRLGLISNRGMLVVAAAFGLAAQGDSKLFAEVVSATGKWLLSWTEQLHLGTGAMVGGALVLMVAAVGVLRVFSIVIAFLQYQGFVLHDHDGRLFVQRGLLTRMRGSLPRARIQAFHLVEGFLHRRFGRRSLDVDTMAMQNDAEGNKGSLRHLVPIATPAAMDAIVSRLLPHAAWPPAQWQPLPTRTWVRRFVPGALFWLAASAGFAWRFGPPAAFVLLGVPWAAYSAWRWVRSAAYSAEGGLVVVREGWLDRSWRFAELGKVQGLRLARSPIDRRFGTASLLLDTAGVTPGASGLRLRYLPLAEAQALYARLADAIARAPVAAGRRARRAPVTRARSAATAALAP